MTFDEVRNVAALSLSRFNSRKTRPDAQVERLAERMRRNGFESTRALWITAAGEVFAGGTRLLAARLAGIAEVPCRVFADVSDDEIARLEDIDNTNDEYHSPVPVVDTWAECHRLNRVEGWTQQRIADAKGWDQPTVARRVKWHESIPKIARKAVCDGILDEGHLEAVSSVVCDVAYLQQWLTTDQAQAELVAEVLDKHRGSSAGIKPTVKVVREAAKRWRELIAAAASVAESLEDPTDFVLSLDCDRARSLAAIERAAAQARAAEARRAKATAEAARAAVTEADEAERKAAEIAAQAERRAAFVERCVLGDAREAVVNCPTGATLLLTDPPYGVDHQSGRRVTSAKKQRIQGDDAVDAALAMLRDVLTLTLPRLADDAHVLVFTGWRFEPEFRSCIVDLGLTIRGSLVWVKNNHGTGDLRGSFAPKHERIIHAVKGNPALVSRSADVLVGHDQQNSEHPTEKPLDLLTGLISATTEPGELVLDPFAGSGSSLLAAHRAGRLFWGCEIDETWHALAADRLLGALDVAA